MKRTQSSPVRRPRAEFWKSIPRSSQVVAIVGVFSLFASIGLIWMLMSPVHQTIESAGVTVAIYGGFAVGYAAMSMVRKFWLIPVWALLQAAAFTVTANIFRAGIIEGRKELEHQLVALGVCAILAIVVAYIAFIIFVRREGTRYFRIQTEIDGVRHIARTPHASLAWLVSLDYCCGQRRVCSSHVLRSGRGSVLQRSRVGHNSNGSMPRVKWGYFNS